MIRNWKNNPKNREKEKKMVRYYVSAWPKKPIKGTSVFGPKILKYWGGGKKAVLSMLFTGE